MMTGEKCQQGSFAGFRRLAAVAVFAIGIGAMSPSLADESVALGAKKAERNKAELYLRGVVMARPPAALISISNEPEGVYKVGDQVVNGVTIRKIEARQILLATPGGEIRVPIRGRRTVDVSHLPVVAVPPPVEIPPASSGPSVATDGAETSAPSVPAPSYDGRSEHQRRVDEESAKPEKSRASVDPTPHDQMPKAVNPRLEPEVPAAAKPPEAN